MRYVLILTLLVLAGWLIKRKLSERIRRVRGLAPEPQPSVRPITIISGAILLVYGGYMLWYMVSRGYQAF